MLKPGDLETWQPGNLAWRTLLLAKSLDPESLILTVPSTTPVLRRLLLATARSKSADCLLLFLELTLTSSYPDQCPFVCLAMW
jgi:hypothetical protein